MSDFKLAISWWGLILTVVLLTSVVVGTCRFISKPAQLFDRVTDPDHIIASYEEFHDIYNTCLQLCDDLEVMKNLPEGESGGFSKAERILALEQNLNRWVNDYNSKSSQISRNVWKHGDLPRRIEKESICK
jgi:hypothetical protein